MTYKGKRPHRKGKRTPLIFYISLGSQIEINEARCADGNHGTTSPRD